MMTNIKQGIILRGIGGFYYVEAADAVYTCRARGNFRRQGITPVAGDRVEIEVQPSGEGVVTQVLERRNSLLRPPVANLDLLVMVASVCQPVTNTLVLDKMIAVAEKKGITPIVVINKADLADETENRAWQLRFERELGGAMLLDARKRIDKKKLAKSA
jgi:ribosome biogenesis GTPase